MSFLILGSNSFSGGSFINYLLDNTQEQIFAVSRSDENDKVLLSYKNNPQNSRVTFYKLDINYNLDKIVDLIRDYKIEYIVNFSAQGMVTQSWDNPLDWFNTNTLSLVALLDKIYKFDFIKKFIQASTPEVYGSCENIKESHTYTPSTPYAVSKASADMILYAYFKTHNFPVNYTRSSNVYGAYQQLYRIIPKTVLSIKKGIKLALHGGGTSIRNFIHIDDVSKATLHIALHAKRGEIYHLCDSKIISIYDLVNMIANQLDKNINDIITITDDRIGKDNIYLMNNDKIINEFDIKPTIHLQNGIQNVIEWIDNNFDKLITYPDYYIHKK